MPDTLKTARGLDRPKAPLHRLARRAAIGLEDAEVIVAQLVADLREAGWFVEQSAVTMPTEAPPIDPRVATALAQLARCVLFSTDAPTARDARRAPASTICLLEIAEGKI